MQHQADLAHGFVEEYNHFPSNIVTRNSSSTRPEEYSNVALKCLHHAVSSAEDSGVVVGAGAGNNADESTNMGTKYVAAWNW